MTDRAQTGRLLSGRHPFNTCSCGWLQVYSELLKQCGGVIKSRTDLKDLMDELKVGARHPNTHFRVRFCVVLLVSWQKSLYQTVSLGSSDGDVTWPNNLLHVKF